MAIGLVAQSMDSKRLEPCMYPLVVNCAGTDASSEHVRRGMACVFDRYAKPNSPLYALQSEARAAQAGLWRDSQPRPPWEFRVIEGHEHFAYSTNFFALGQSVERSAPRLLFPLLLLCLTNSTGSRNITVQWKH